MRSFTSPLRFGRPPSAQARARGFSLVELMVAITLGLFLVIGLISLITSNTVTRAELDKSSRQIENGRYAVQLMSEDIQHAGFVGSTLTRTAGSVVQAAPAPCPANVSNLAYVAAPNFAASVPFSVYTAPGTATCITNYAAGTGAIVVTRVGTASVPVASATANEVYLQASTCSTQTTAFDVAVAGGSFTRTATDCVTPAALRKVVQHLYFISTCNVCSPTDNLPTLKMAEYVNGAMQVTPLVEGIQDLQVEYGIDMDSNGSPDCYTSDPADTVGNALLCPTPAAYSWAVANINWSNVVTVKLYLLARNNDLSGGWTDTRTYAMGLAKGVVGPFNDKYKRHVYSVVARLYNISGQRELQ